MSALLYVITKSGAKHFCFIKRLLMQHLSKEQAGGFEPTTFDGKRFFGQISSPPHQVTSINP